MAVKYVRHDADGSGDGSTTASSGANGAWTFAQMLAATPAAGDEIRIMATGTYSRSATGTIAYANGTDAANIVLIGANSSGVVDYNYATGAGSRPTIQAAAGSINLLATAANHLRIANLILDGNSQASVQGLVMASTYSRCQKIKALNCPLRGINIQGGNSCWGERLEATGCGVGVYATVSGHLYYVDAYANTTGIMVSAGVEVAYFKSYANTSHGIDFDSVGGRLLQGVVYGNGGKGINLEGNVGFGTPIINVVSYGNTGQDFYASGVRSGAYLLNCAGRAGVANNNNGTGYHTTNLPNVENYVTLTGDPFTNAASGNFLPNNTAGAGAALRAAGLNNWPAGGTSYFDIGLQHQDSGGGGGGGGINRGNWSGGF